MKILITGGAGFVGSSLAVAYREKYPTSTILALDNLKRRGSEINLPRFKKHNIQFQHGDIRNLSDLLDLPGCFDVFIEASAEPSVLAGLNESPNYLIQSNLTGTLNCLEFARQKAASFFFLSTSRVYSMEPLRSILIEETPTRFEIKEGQSLPGISNLGIAEDFPVHLPRSLYGATKLASEIMIQEYAETYGLSTIINRCGVIAGPGQFGKVDQGVFTLWVANHFFNKPLQYTGFGGTGKQVRDLLHPLDLFELLEKQLAKIEFAKGKTYNVGGGRDVSTSLFEYTQVCQNVMGKKVTVNHAQTTSAVDIPIYISDNRSASQMFDWAPKRTVRKIVQDIASWLEKNEVLVRPLFNL